MAAFTDYLENALLKHIRNEAAYTAPTTIYVALFTSATDDAGGGTEVTGGAYARQSVTWAAVASGETSNTTEIAFPTATADWGLVTHAALFDALTGGNMLFHAELNQERSIVSGETYKFRAADLKMRLA